MRAGRNQYQAVRPVKKKKSPVGKIIAGVLIGASRAEQVRENAKALENTDLTAEELGEIDAVLAERQD